jgi:hypothetical protein
MTRQSPAPLQRQLVLFPPQVEPNAAPFSVAFVHCVSRKPFGASPHEPVVPSHC